MLERCLIMDATEYENYKIETDSKIATLESDLTKAKESADAKDKEIAKLQAYIANYVSSDHPSKQSEDEIKPKSFADIYNETISEMAKK